MADKQLIWLHGEVKTPPLSEVARQRAGFHLRFLQRGNALSMPHSRPMPGIGPRCHELRVPDPEKGITWRIIYRMDVDEIVVADVFAKKTQKTPQNVIDATARRYKIYDSTKDRG
jgi:phage-related protein